MKGKRPRKIPRGYKTRYGVIYDLEKITGEDKYMIHEDGSISFHPYIPLIKVKAKDYEG